jgi:hypothetical protein
VGIRMTSKDNTQDKDQDKALLERYRRASDADTAAPSEAVRAAILAEGRRAADARAKDLRGQPFDTSRPAANDSRWKITAFGTAGAGLLAALLFAPNLWKTVPPSPSPSASASAPASAPADAAQSSTAVPSPEPASLHPFSDARESAAQSRPQEAAEQPKATGLQRRSESQQPQPQRKIEALAQSDALAEKAAPLNYTTPQPAAPSAVPPATASTSTAPAFSGGVPAASSARDAKIPPVSSLIAGRYSGMPSEPRQEALQSAAASGDAVQTATLLDQGAPLDARDEHGRTPLMRAVMQNRLQVVRLLLDRGADPNLADNTGSTPLQQAKRGNLNDIAAMLQRAGAH